MSKRPEDDTGTIPTLPRESAPGEYSNLHATPEERRARQKQHAIAVAEKREAVEETEKRLEYASALRDGEYRRLVRAAKKDRAVLTYVKPTVASRIEAELGFTPAGGLHIPGRYVRPVVAWIKRRIDGALDRAIGGAVGGGVVLALLEFVRAWMHGHH